MLENKYNYFQKSFNLKHRVSQIHGAPKLHKDKKTTKYNSVPYNQNAEV